MLYAQYGPVCMLLVGCHGLRQRALYLRPWGLTEYFEQSQIKILEFIGQCRQIGITFSELQIKLVLDMVRKTEKTYVLPVQNGMLVYIDTAH